LERSGNEGDSAATRSTCPQHASRCKIWHYEN
jgi:hypothetical protein